MQNKTEFSGALLPQRVKGFVAGKQRAISLCGSVAAGFIMANCFLFGGVSPFGVAFVAVLDNAFVMFGAIGALLGYLFSADMLSNVKYMAAAVLAVLARWLFGGRFGKKNETLFSVALCFLCLGLCSGAAILLGEITLYDVMLGTGELFLGCGAAYFFARSISLVNKSVTYAARADVSCAAISVCVLLMGLTSVKIAGLSVGRILGVLVILLCAFCAREAGGAIAGIAAGACAGLASGNPGYVIGAYGFGGLAAGVFGQMGRIAAAGAFIAVNTGGALLTMEYAAANLAIYEVFAASVIFIAIPGSWISGFQSMRLNADKLRDDSAPASLTERLYDISSALREIGETTHAVSKKLGKIEPPDASVLCERVARRVCEGCGMKASCWRHNYSATVAAFNDCIAIMRKNGALSKEQAPRHFLHNCVKPDELLAETRTQFGAIISREGVQRKVAKVRAVITDQFEGIAMMLDEVSAELSSVRYMEERKCRRVREYFLRRNIPLRRLSCSEDRCGRISVELVTANYQAARVTLERTTLDLCAMLEADFDLPEVIARERYTTFTFCEKAAYAVEIGAYQLSGGGSRFCGDAYDFIRGKNGRAHFILSDGMGSGGSAAVDSSMACGLLIKLASVGISYEAALKMVNSALLVKSGEESLATIDVCVFDLFTGKARFYKAGAAPTFIVKDGKAGQVESASLPAGILHGVSFETSGVTLHEGDVVVMVSDGVVATGTDWLKSELGLLRDTDMQRLCERLALTAKMRRADGHDDDITVLAAAVRRC